MKKRATLLLLFCFAGCNKLTQPSTEEIRAERLRLAKTQTEQSNIQQLQTQKIRQEKVRAARLRTEKARLEKVEPEFVAKQKAEQVKAILRAEQQKRTTQAKAEKKKTDFQYKGLWAVAQPDDIIMKGRNFTPPNTIEITRDNHCFVNENEMTWHIVSKNTIHIEKRVKMNNDMAFKQPEISYEILEMRCVFSASGRILDVSHKFGWVNEWEEEFKRGTYQQSTGSPKTYTLYKQ